MTDAARPDDPLFEATLHPHRSLGRGGTAALVGFVGVTCFLAGLLFWRIGAWPVAGFFGLDVALVWLALHLNFRDAKAYEEVFLSREWLVIRRFAPSGRLVGEVRLNPAWVKFDVTRAEDEGVTRVAVRLRGDSHAIGTFLNPGDRESFARAFGVALAAAKRG